MTNSKIFDVIIIGGSYAGLSAAMALGRSLRNVLIIDSGNPCNVQTPYSHNFITQDGKKPADISAKAREQVLQYSTVSFKIGKAIKALKKDTLFEIHIDTGEKFIAQKLIFASGLKDLIPDIEGFLECWGISILHCPYCHGYEVKNEQTGILSNGDEGYEFCKLISNWTKNLTLFTNGKSTLTEEHTLKLIQKGIKIVETEIDKIEHNDGLINQIIFKNQSSQKLNTLYARIPFVQHCDLPIELGCELTEQGLIKVNSFQKTTVNGIYAIGDNTTFGRAVSVAISQGTIAGAFLNKEMIDEEF